MKTSEVLRAARPLLMRADNPFGETRICAAILKSRGGVANDAIAIKAIRTIFDALEKMTGEMTGGPCYYLSEAMRRVGWIPNHRRPSDPLFWPIRDSWLDKLITECEKNGD